MDQKRILKQAKTQRAQKDEGGTPRLIAVVGLHESVNVDCFAQAFIKFLLFHNVKLGQLKQDQADKLYESQVAKALSQQIVTTTLPGWAGKRYKQIQFVFCRTTDVSNLTPEQAFQETLTILDVCKAADGLLALFGDASLDSPAFGKLGNEVSHKMQRSSQNSIL